MNRLIRTLIIGDVILLAVFTLVGFAFHGELDTPFAARMLTTFVPLLIAWFLAAPWLKLFDLETTRELRQIWRPVWAMTLAGPMAAFLRSVMLNQVILPLFVVVITASAALGMLIWRTIWVYWVRRA